MSAMHTTIGQITKVNPAIGLTGKRYATITIQQDNGTEQMLSVTCAQIPSFIAQLAKTLDWHASNAAAASHN